MIESEIREKNIQQIDFGAYDATTAHNSTNYEADNQFEAPTVKTEKEDLTGRAYNCFQSLQQ